MLTCDRVLSEDNFYTSNLQNVMTVQNLWTFPSNMILLPLFGEQTKLFVILKLKCNVAWGDPKPVTISKERDGFISVLYHTAPILFSLAMQTPTLKTMIFGVCILFEAYSL